MQASFVQSELLKKKSKTALSCSWFFNRSIRYDVGERVDVFFAKHKNSWWEGHIKSISEVDATAIVDFTCGCDQEEVPLENLRTSIHF